jgi:hypothetical protein
LLKHYKRTQWDKISLFISFIFIFRFSYRHSLDSTSLKIKSEIKVHNLLLKHYKRTQWDKISLFISFIFIFRFSYRHSLDSTSLKIKSEIKVHNIWRGNIPRCPSPISFVHTSFDSGPRVGKKPIRISADGFYFGSYSHFTGISAYNMV